ncbi:MAG TPA: hypothetical protein VG897_06445 [Terriglobales bacterium]|nr:hypothetical protein [Terriglobales bacterium]
MKHLLRIWLIVVTVALLLFATTAEAAHIHANNHVSQQHAKKTSDSCLICHAAHSPVLAAKILLCPTPVLVEEDVYLFDSRPHSQLEAIRLYVRPPPAI